MLDPSFLQSVNVDILPDDDATRNLGSSDKRWLKIWTKYLDGFIIFNPGGNDYWFYIATSPSVADRGGLAFGQTARYMFRVTTRGTGGTSGYLHIFSWDTANNTKYSECAELTLTGDLYVYGDYYTYSPDLPTLAEVRKNPDMLYKEIYRIACIPSSKGKKLPEDEELRHLVLQKAFAKDISKTALLNARLVVILYERVKQLEEENKYLKDELNKLKSMINSLVGGNG